MRLLLLGAYGFIGGDIARRLLAGGHHVRALGRDVAYGRRLLPAAEWIKADLATMTATSEIAVIAQDRIEQPIALVEHHERSLDEIIAAHRAWLAVDQPRHSLRIPAMLVRAACAGSDLLGRMGWRSALRTNAIKALRAGVTGDSRSTAALLGREPRSLEEMLGEAPAGKQDRIAARLYWLMPLIVAALFLMWLLSGLATLLDLTRSEALFERQLGTTARRVLVYAGAAIDIALALALLWRRSARAAAIGMVMVTIVYLSIASMLVPSLWLDPLAPLAKALPGALLAVIAAWMLDRR